MTSTFRVPKDLRADPLPYGAALNGDNSTEFNNHEISHYQVDYILTYLDELIHREIKADPNVVFNTEFQKFMQWSNEFRRIALAARVNPYTAYPPFAPLEAPVQYGCGGGGHNFSTAVTDMIRDLINKGSLDPLVYNNALGNGAVPYTPKYAYFEVCSMHETQKMINDVIIPTMKSLDAYMKSKTSGTASNPVQVLENEMKKFRTQFTQAMSEINNQVENGDYRARYDLIERKLTDTINLLDQIVSAVSTDLQVIEGGVHRDKYYDRLKFSDDKIDPALIITKDTFDLVDRSKVLQDLKDSVKKYNNMGGLSAITSAYGIPAQSNPMIINNHITALIDMMSKLTNITTNPKDDIRNLAKTKLYTDNTGKKVAAALDDAELADQLTAEKAKQEAYLQRLYYYVQSRQDRYKTAYQTGGGMSASIRQASTQKLALVQTGGDNVDVSDLAQQATDTKMTIDEINKNITDISLVELPSIVGLQQRNYFLLEAMNMLIVSRFLMGSQATQQTQFLDELKTRMNKFKSTLTNTWDIMNQQVIADVDNNAILKKFTENGIISINEIRDLLTQIGTTINVSVDDDDEMINRAKTIKVIGALASKYGIENIHDISQRLYDLFSTGDVTDVEKVGSVQELYAKLSNYYSQVEELESNLTHYYRSFDASTRDFDNIRRFAGDVISANLSVINASISDLIDALKSFDRNVDAIDKIDMAVDKTRLQINDYSSYLKECNNSLASRKDRLDDKHADFLTVPSVGLLATNFVQDDVTQFYKDRIDNYLVKISDASNNVINHYAYQRDLDQINSRQHVIDAGKYEYEIAATAVYEKWSGTNIPDFVLVPASILTEMYRSDPSDINVDAGLDAMYDPITKILDLYTCYGEDNGNCNKSWLFYTPLAKRINIHPYVREIMSAFACYLPLIAQRVAKRYLPIVNGDELGPYPGLTRDDQAELMTWLSKRMQQYVMFINKYGENRDIHNVDDRDVQKIQAKLTSLAYPEKANEFLGYLNGLNNITIANDPNDDTKYKFHDDLMRYLETSREQRNMSHELFRDTVINQFNETTISIFELFNEKFQERYRNFHGLSLYHDPTNPDYASIRIAQGHASKLQVESQAMRLLPNLREIERTPEILLPVPDLLNTIGLTDPIVLGGFTVVGLANILADAHNQFNNGKLLESVANYTINDIGLLVASDIQHFYNNAQPLLALMNQLMDNGRRYAWPDVPGLDFEVVTGEISRYNSPFRYTRDDLGITEQSPPKKIVQRYLRNNSTGPPVLPFKKYGQVTRAEIPDFDDDGDQIDVSVQPNRVLYRLGTNSRKNYLVLHSHEFKLNNAPNHQITESQITKLTDIITVANKASEFLKKLAPVIQQHIINPQGELNVINLNIVPTWHEDMSTGGAGGEVLQRRQSMYNRLNVVLRALNDVEDEIRQEKRKGAREILSSLLLGSGSKDSSPIYQASQKLQSLNPKSSEFNTVAYKIFIFVRKVLYTWFPLLGYMVSSILLNRTFNVVQSVIREMNIDPDNILQLAGYEDLVNDIPIFEDVINRELGTARSNTQKEIDGLPLDFTLNQSIKDAVKFDKYYSNIGSSSQRVYTIVALIDSSDAKSKELLKSLHELNEYTVEALDLLDAITPFYTTKYFLNKINSTAIPPKRDINSVKTLVENFVDTVITDMLTNAYSKNDPDTPLTVEMHELRQRLISFVQTAKKHEPKTEPDNDNLIHLNDPSHQHNPKAYTDYNGQASSLWNYYAYAIDAFMKNKNDNGRTLLHVLATIIASKFFQEFRWIFASPASECANAVIDTHHSSFYNIRENFSEVFQLIEFSEVITKKHYDRMNDELGNANYDIAKIARFGPSTDIQDNQLLLDINDVFKNVTDHVKSSLLTTYETQRNNYQVLTSQMDRVRNNLSRDTRLMMVQIDDLRRDYDVARQVMFNDYYKQFAFVEKTFLMGTMTQVINNYERMWDMLSRKLEMIVTHNNKNILHLAQVDNYQAFKAVLNKLIDNKDFVPKYYRRLSFGLIEYYYDVIRTIVHCLDTKKFEEMSEIETFLYKYYYIQLKRCNALFQWIRHDYQTEKQRNDDIIIKTVPKHIRLLNYKVDPFMTLGDINEIFLEFQGVRKYLDEYAAIAMDKVQLHLRINDFANKSYNTEIEKINDKTARDTMLDYDPEGDQYLKRWEANQLAFTNPNNKNILNVNFDVVKEIYKYDNPGKPMKQFDLYYAGVYNKMNPVPRGIPFERVYNRRIYPDSDIISNYMSIAPNILNGKGTVIMTYGYSGVGKSASLFGRPANPSQGVYAPSNGILQATLDQFSNQKIFFRVYEIYGLGVQYNYYWNPSSDTGSMCYPKFTQCIIHHVIDASNPNVLRSTAQVPFSNRHDAFAYIMTMRDPSAPAGVDPNNFTINDKSSNLNGYVFNNRFNRNTYVEITPQQYHNFNDFVNSVDDSRRNGFTYTNLLTNTLKQIKGTINNPESSRSILVYDFQIEITQKDAAGTNVKTYVPFLIYDLPGKEDVYRTYVDTSISPGMPPERQKRAFRDLENDESKAEKSTYVTNPLLIPIFKNNTEKIITILRSLSSVSEGTGYRGAKFESDAEDSLVKKILDYEVVSFGYPANATGGRFNTPDSAKFKIRELYQNEVNTFVGMFNDNNIVDDYYGSTGAIKMKYTYDMGIVNRYLCKDKNCNTYELFVLISVVIIAFLIEYQYFDIIVEFIHAAVNGVDGPDNDDNGGWSRSKIYAFFEAYYINENVVGLLQYLIKDILEDTHGINPQLTSTDKISDTIKDNYQTAVRYRVINNIVRSGGKTVGMNYGLKVNPDLLKIDANDETAQLRGIEINDFVAKNGVNSDDGVFADKSTDIDIAIDRMNNAISLENRGKYDSNRIFRDGSKKCNDPIANSTIVNPNTGVLTPETNRPLIQDFLEPYRQKLSFYYVFYVVSNSQNRIKAEEQIKLLNNSMVFVDKISPSNKLNKCSS